MLRNTGILTINSEICSSRKLEAVRLAQFLTTGFIYARFGLWGQLQMLHMLKHSFIRRSGMLIGSGEVSDLSSGLASFKFCLQIEHQSILVNTDPEPACRVPLIKVFFLLGESH